MTRERFIAAMIGGTVAAVIVGLAFPKLRSLLAWTSL